MYIYIVKVKHEDMLAFLKTAGVYVIPHIVLFILIWSININKTINLYLEPDPQIILWVLF